MLGLARGMFPFYPLQVARRQKRQLKRQHLKPNTPYSTGLNSSAPAPSFQEFKT